MASNPKIVSCPIDDWAKVASGLTRGGIALVSSKAMYLWTYREQGQAFDPDVAEGARIDGNRLDIDSKAPIDIYIKAIRDVGTVRVDDWG